MKFLKEMKKDANKPYRFSQTYRQHQTKITKSNKYI